MNDIAISTTSVLVADGQVELQVQIAGTGPALVYLHPAGGLAWDGFLGELTKSFTVHAPELPGTSPARPGDLDAIQSLPELVGAYGDGLRALGLEGSVVIGQSFGGMLAAELAAAFPALFSKVVLLAPIGGDQAVAPIADLWSAEFGELPGLLFHDPTGPAAQGFLAMPDDPAVIAQVVALIGRALQCSGKFVSRDGDLGLPSRLSGIAAPTLVVWGELDTLVPVVHAADFGNRIPNAQVKVVAGSGHIVQVEKEAETTALVQAFLS